MQQREARQREKSGSNTHKSDQKTKRDFLCKTETSANDRRSWDLVDLLGISDVGQSLEEATLAQYSLPQLHADDAEYEEDEEAQQQDVAQHREGVEQQHHQDPHTCVADVSRKDHVSCSRGAWINLD